jgi:hypothetical protein
VENPIRGGVDVGRHLEFKDRIRVRVKVRVRIGKP